MKQKKIKTPEGSTRLHVEIDRRCDHSHHSDERYGEWSESYSNSLGPVSIETRNGFYGEVVPFKVEEGDTIYVVWAVWSSGDSFGSGTDNSSTILAIYKTAKRAMALKKIAEQSNGSFKFLDENGQEMTDYASWSGYFESLTGIHVTPALVGGSS